MDESDVPDSDSIDTPSLANQLRHLRLGNYQGVSSDATRPTKRRKTSSGQDILGEVVKEAYLLLGSQSASDLDGLRHVVG